MNNEAWRWWANEPPNEFRALFVGYLFEASNIYIYIYIYTHTHTYTRVYIYVYRVPSNWLIKPRKAALFSA